MYLERLAASKDVQKFVAENPYGQRPIREKNLSWRFYQKVIPDTAAGLATQTLLEHIAERTIDVAAQISLEPETKTTTGLAAQTLLETKTEPATVADAQTLSDSKTNTIAALADQTLLETKSEPTNGSIGQTLFKP
ncbi:hypothetical protein Tco_0018963 [Tanacetum coccineum]